MKEQERASAAAERRNQRLEADLKRARADGQRLTAELAKTQQLERVARNLQRQGYTSPGGGGGGGGSSPSRREAELETEVAALQSKLAAERAWALQWKGECAAVREELRALLGQQVTGQQVTAMHAACTPPRKERPAVAGSGKAEGNL